MQARDMVDGQIYFLKKDNQTVECSHLSSTGKYMIVHPPGEPDMQSSFGIPLDEECEPTVYEKPTNVLEVLKECGTYRQQVIWLLHYLEAQGHDGDAAVWIKRRREISDVKFVEKIFGEMMESK